MIDKIIIKCDCVSWGYSWVVEDLFSMCENMKKIEILRRRENEEKGSRGGRKDRRKEDRGGRKGW